MTHFNIAHSRLLNQHIARATFQKPQDVVEWLVASQAQDHFGAKWALGLRMQGATDVDGGGHGHRAHSPWHTGCVAHTVYHLGEIR